MTKKRNLTIADRTEELVSEFDLFDNSMDRYEYIIDLGKAMPEMEETLKTENRLVKGCQSKVWLDAKMEGEQLVFMADSNTVITKGIIAILIRIVSGEKPETIAKDDFSFIDKINLRSHLSSQRSNGLSAMIALMKQYAVHFSK